jgi:hypothetical protein
LKAEWIGALQKGLAKSGLSLPIKEADVRFPYYGDSLYEMDEGTTPNEAAEVVVRGKSADEAEKRFILAVVEEARTRAGITDEQLAEVGGSEVIRRGPQHWEWVQTILKAIDRFVPKGSGASIALFTHDVYVYLRNSSIRQQIDDGVAKAMAPNVESIVVSHSLGTVVAYNLLRQARQFRGWNVPLFVTLGSPLAVTEIRKTVKSFAPTRCPECVLRWFNAMDERDVVALYPLDPKSFPLDPDKPAIENKRDVDNWTENHHGIVGYLDDKGVAKQIYDALTA